MRSIRPKILQRIFLHIIDYATRLPVTVVKSSKKQIHIVHAIMRYFFALYGTVEKFPTDNGGKFINDEFITLSETLNINIHTTGAGSSWSNGIVERHNFVLSEMLNKVLEENHCSLDMVLAWYVTTKNYLQNVHRFSPLQVAVGQNPSLPCATTDRVSASSPMQTCEIIRQQLNNIHQAKEAFISENFRENPSNT